MKKLLALVLIYVCVPSALAQFSFSTDFDGRGTGGSISFNRPTFGGSGPNYDSPQRGSGGGGGGGSSYEEQRHLRQVYLQQVLEAKRRAEEERIRQELERQRRLNNVHQVQKLLEKLHELEADEPSIDERLRIKTEIVELEKDFAQKKKDYLEMLPSLQSRLAWTMDHIVVPPPEHPRNYDRILMLGTQASPEQAQKFALSDKNLDPFTGERYDDAFAFGTEGLIDWKRSAFDHLLGQLNMLSPETVSRLGMLKGATADEVVCHSNGCRVAEVMIKRGELTVRRLRILGGDNVLLELGDMKRLQEHYGLEELSVYMTKGDIIPVISLGAWKIIDLAGRLGRPLESLARFVNDPTYQAMGLVERPPYDPEAPFQARFLSYPAASAINVYDKHIYENYSRMINGWRMTGCLNPEGATDKRCMVY